MASLDPESPAPGSGGGGDSKADLSVYLRAVRRHWLVCLLIAATTAGGVAAWTYRQPRIYDATCAIVIDSAPPQVLQGVKDVVELGSGPSGAGREYIDTQFRIMRSTEVLQRVAEKLRLAHDPDFSGGGPAPSLRAVADMLVGRIRIASVKDSRVANITVEDTSPGRAALIANTLADTYIEYNLDYKMSGVKTATALLGEQENDYRKQLEASELALYQFRRDKNLLAVGLDDRRNMTSQNLEALNAKLSEIMVKRIEMEAKRKLILAARDNPEEAETLPEIRESSVLGALRADFIQMRKKEAEVRARYEEKHPEVQKIEVEMASVQRDYQQEMDRLLKSFDKSYEALIDAERALDKRMEEEKREAIDLSKVEVEYKPLQRAAENNNRVYALITQRQKEIDLTSVMRTNNVRILDRALPADAPVRPKLLFNVGIGILLGLAASIGFVFLLDTLDRTVKTQEDAERLCGASVLGVIPIIGEKIEKKKVAAGTPLDDLRDRDLSVFRNSKSQEAECCRSLRTNLLFMSPDRPVRTLVVTSPGSEEGKTTVAINLGATLAIAGSRVLLMDTDMRRPRLHRSFGVSNEVGVSTVILGEAKLDDAIKRTEVPCLDVIPCGPTPPNPAELLHTERFSKIVRECAARYDRIVLDSPPTEAVTDSAILGNLCDGVLLVVRAARTRREAAQHARRHLDAAKARILGVVVNEVDAGRGGYGYGYHGYYRYGGYYGKTDEKAEA